jgi:hypothetical protein
MDDCVGYADAIIRINSYPLPARRRAEYRLFRDVIFFDTV